MSYDYTTFTEVDVPADRISSTAATITVTNLDTDEEVYSYLDCGVDCFDGDYEFQFNFNVSVANSDSACYLLGLANAVDDLYATTITNNLDAHIVTIAGYGAVYTIAIAEFNGGSGTGTTGIPLQLNTGYYATIVRDESVGTHGRLTISVYSDSNRTTHVSGSPKAITLTEKADFRYLYGMSGGNFGGGGVAISLELSNLTALEYPYYEMWDYLSTVTADSDYTLDVHPSNVLVESGEKNGIIHLGDDGSEERISLDDDSFFYVTLEFSPISEATSSTISDFFNSYNKGNGMSKSFKWINYGEPSSRRHTYVVRFDSDMSRTINPGNKYDINSVRLKVLGRA